MTHSFADQGFRECRDYVAFLLGLSPNNPHTPAALGPARPELRLQQFQPDQLAIEQGKLLRARRLWDCRLPVEGSPVERYLREARAYTGTIPGTIGHLPPGAYPYPAMIAAFGIADEPEPGLVEIGAAEVQGIHLTFVADDGGGKADTDKPKIMLGASTGWPIIVAPPNDLLGLAVTEGSEDGLSVHQATGLGAWAAGSAGRMPALAPTVPGYIECVTIYAHPDDAGQCGAIDLADALTSRGMEVFIEGIK